MQLTKQKRTKCNKSNQKWSQNIVQEKKNERGHKRKIVLQ